MINMENREKILKKHYWNMCQTDVNKEVIANESPFIYNAMQEYADQQTKALKDEIEYMKHTLENDVIHINKLQSRISELEKGNKWISIEDKLPNHREQVLGFPKQYPFGLIRECSYEEYTGQDLEWFKEAFSHWMPLPNKPKTN